MYIDLNKILASIGACLPAGGEPSINQLHRMYDLTLRLISQELAVIYDRELFDGQTGQRPLAEQQSTGTNSNAVVTLTIQEPLPSMKKLTEALEEHWKAMIHAAIAEAARQEPLPYFERAFVEIKIITTRGCNNAKVWDTSNRAINGIINNLKGIFFEDDNMEHMGFSVVGKWGEKGTTIIRISDFDKLLQIRGSSSEPFLKQTYEDQKLPW